MSTQGSAIGCVVGDDHPLMRLGLRRAIEAAPGLELLGEATADDTLLAVIHRRRPKIAVVDLATPGFAGTELLARLRAGAPSTQILAYTVEASARQVEAAMAAGVCGFVLKSSPVTEIIRAIWSAASGHVHVDRAISDPERPALSRRETEVLQQLADGATTAAAAEALFLSPTTVRSYAETAMRKLASRTRTQAVAAALREGMIG